MTNEMKEKLIEAVMNMPRYELERSSGYSCGCHMAEIKSYKEYTACDEYVGIEDLLELIRGWNDR